MIPRFAVGLGLLGIASAFCGCTDASGEEAGAFVPRARELIEKFQANLKSELQAAMKAGGPVAAISVCSDRAPQITELTKRNGMRVRRIGTRVRNHATNVPTPLERALLAQLDASDDAGIVLHGEVVTADGRERIAARAYYHPIRIADAACLLCHGPTEQLAPEVVAALAERYPQDEATGYAIGDLRGAFVVETDVR